MKITIDCPVCYSSNYFVSGTTEKLSCEDCGFFLAANSQMLTDKCIFCGSRSFYLDSPFGLGFLGHDTVCYVCEAHYRKTRIDNPDLRYSEESFARAQASNEAREFQERASLWH